jgi:hypothetical protein
MQIGRAKLHDCLIAQIFSTAVGASLPSSLPSETSNSLVPSGDQLSTMVETDVRLVRGAAPVPSALIVHSLEGPHASVPSRARSAEKAIFIPSGNQRGRRATPMEHPVSLVRGAALVPSAFTTQMFLLAFVLSASLPSKARADEKTILLPSGDQDQSIKSAKVARPVAVSRVNGMLPVPSAFTTQRFNTSPIFAALLPSRARPDEHAILLAPADQAKSSTALSVSWVKGMAPKPLRHC